MYSTYICECNKVEVTSALLLPHDQMSIIDVGEILDTQLAINIELALFTAYGITAARTSRNR